MLDVLDQIKYGIKINFTCCLLFMSMQWLKKRNTTYMVPIIFLLNGSVLKDGYLGYLQFI